MLTLSNKMLTLQPKCIKELDVGLVCNFWYKLMCVNFGDEKQPTVEAVRSHVIPAVDLSSEPLGGQF